MISGNTPKHLVVAARTGFLQAMRVRDYPWQQIAMTLQMDAASIDLVDLGAAPMPTKSKTGVTIQDFIEKTKVVTPSDWDITVWMTQNQMDDDQTGTLERRVRQAGDNFQKHINKRVFQVLNAGDSATEGLTYDGTNFFNSAHIDKGADFQTGQDNEDTNNLSQPNFDTTWVNAQTARDDQGEFTQYIYDLLVTHPSNNVTAANITGNPQDQSTANRAINPYAGDVSYLTSSYLDTNAWYLIASKEPIKPLILAMKKEPHLQSTWFDAEAPDGGRHYFKFFARYEVHYGDWRLAWQGQT